MRNLTSIRCDVAVGVSRFPGTLAGELFAEPSATLTAAPEYEEGEGEGTLMPEWSRRGHTAEDRTKRRVGSGQGADRKQSAGPRGLSGTQSAGPGASLHSGTARTARGRVTETAKRQQPLRLPVNGESAASFARSAGRSVLVAKRNAAAEEEALAAGRGLALDITATQWTLGPFGTWRCEVTAHTNAPGFYDDVFAIRIGPLPARLIPVRVGVVGTPLEAHLERRRTLGAPGPGHCHARSLPMVRFGGNPTGSEPLHRTFHVTNTSPYAMRVVWAAHRYLPEEAESVVAVSAREHGLGVQLSVLPRTDPAGAPYAVSPESAVVPPRATLPFTCTFFPDESGAHDAVLVGTHEFALPGSGAEGAEPGPWRDLRLTLRDPYLRWGDADGAVLAAAISGGFHPFAAAPAAQMPPLRVGVEGRAVPPQLQVENRNKLRFKCSTAHDPQTHPSFRRVITLTNSTLMALSGSLSTAPPFVLTAVQPSVPQLPFGGAPLPARVYTVPPRETLEVAVAFELPPTEHPRLLDYTLDGSLSIAFTTGAVQVFPLLAEVFHPAVAAAPAALAFGRVHCANPRVLKLELSNATQADAEWAADVEDDGESVFTVTPERGTLPGRGMGHPTTTIIEVRFRGSLSPCSSCPVIHNAPV